MFKRLNRKSMLNKNFQHSAMSIQRQNFAKVEPANSALFVCDIQTKFEPIIKNIERVINSTKFLIKAFDVFDIPIIVTEQYPNYFGPTVKELKDVLDASKNVKIFPKTKFSMSIEPVINSVDPLVIKNIVITGIEVIINGHPFPPPSILLILNNQYFIRPTFVSFKLALISKEEVLMCMLS